MPGCGAIQSRSGFGPTFGQNAGLDAGFEWKCVQYQKFRKVVKLGSEIRLAGMAKGNQ
jgi:hypothetical protein